MILVTGQMDIDPDKRDEFVDLIRPLMTATREEAGCDHYAFTADVEDPGRFHIHERWEDDATMDAHSKSEHLAAFMGSLGGIVRGASLTRWDGGTPSTLI
jgi:quinol monooxygenase YgiN